GGGGGGGGRVGGVRARREPWPAATRAGRRQAPAPANRRPPASGRELVVKGAAQHNLKNIDVTIPLGCLVGITGVSGSGKSTLVNDILYRALARELHGARTVPGKHVRVTGVQYLDKV